MQQITLDTENLGTGPAWGFTAILAGKLHGGRGGVEKMKVSVPFPGSGVKYWVVLDAVLLSSTLPS